MPDAGNVGVLELSIKDNSDKAGQGLRNLADALSAVKSAQQSFSLSKVGTEITNLAKTIQEAKGTSTIIKNLGTMFNAINKFASLKSFNIDTEKIRDIANNMLKLADAKEKVENSANAGTSVSNGRFGMDAIANETKQAVETVKKEVDTFEGQMDRAKEIAKGSGDMWGTFMRMGIFSTSPGRKSQGIEGVSERPIIQQYEKLEQLQKATEEFFSRGKADTSKSPVQEKFDGLLQKTTETTQAITSEYKEMVGGLESTKLDFTNFDPSKIPIGMLGSEFREVSDGVLQYKNIVNESMESVARQAQNSVSDVQEVTGHIGPGSVFGYLEDGSRQATDGVSESMSLIVSTSETTTTDIEKQFKDAFDMIVSYANQSASDASEAIKRIAGQNTSVIEKDAVPEDRISFDYLRENAIEVEGTVSETSNAISGYLTGTQETVAEMSSTIHGYLEGLVQDFSKSSEEIKETLRPIYATTSPIGAAFRGDKGYAEKVSARNAVAEQTGFTGGEVNKAIVALAEDARKARAEVQELLNTLNRPIPQDMNWSQGIDRMLGIGSEFKSAAESASAFMTPMYTQVQDLMNQLNTPVKMNWSQAIDQLNGVNAEAKSAEESMSAFLQGMQGDNPLAEKLRELNPELADASKEFTSAAEAAKRFKNATGEVSINAASLKESFHNLWDILKNNTVLGKVAKQFMNVGKRMAIRAVIRQVSSAFQEGVENVYRYSKAIGGSFSSDMDNAATSLLQMKNSIGAALAPAIQAILPYINQLINGFITAINWVNQLFALLRGQSTWTRALPYATEAFEDQTQGARNASKAMKDLLADWDELNIIQSQNDGGTGRSGKEQEDYASMFEEVGSFDGTIQKIANAIRDVVYFIKDNFVFIYGIVKAVKLALRALKFSKAFTETIPLLSKLLGGVAVGAVVGITVAVTDFTGKQFVNTGNPAWLIADALTGAVGSKLAGSIATKIFGGTVGTAVQGFTLILDGAVNLQNATTAFQQQKQAEGWALSALGSAEMGIGTALVAKGLLATTTGFSFALGGLVAAAALTVSLGIAIKTAEDAVDWGTITLTKDEVEEYVQAKFFTGVDVGATIELTKATISKVSVSKADLESQIEGTLPVLTKLKLGINDQDTYDELKKQIFGDDNGSVGLIQKIQTYADSNIQELKVSMSLIPIVDATGSDVSSKFISAGITGWNEVTDYTNQLGEELGKELSKGFTEDGLANFDEEAVKTMTEKLVRISKVITGAQIEGAAQADLGIRLEELSLSDMTQETVNDIVAAFSSYRGELKKEYESIYKESANQYLVLSRFYQEMANQAETDEEKDKWLQKSAEYLDYYTELINDLNRSVLAAVDAASAPGIEMIRNLVQEKFGKEFEGLGRWFTDNNGELTGAGLFWQKLMSPDIGFDPTKDGIEDSANKFNTFLKTWLGNENMFLGQLLNNMPEVNVFSLLSDEMQADLKKVIASQYGQEFADNLFEQFVAKPIEEMKNAADDATSSVPNVESTKDQTTESLSSAKEQIDSTKESVDDLTDSAKEAKNSLTLDDVTMDTTSVETGANSAATAIEEMARRIREAFATLDGLSYEMDIGGEKYSGAMKVLIPVQQKATGGFVRSGDLVMANENGNFEMMGKMGRQPVVANNQQIVSGISQGVATANGDVVSELRTLTTLMQKMLNKEFVARAVPSASWGDHNARSKEAYDRVTG